MVLVLRAIFLATSKRKGPNFTTTPAVSVTFLTGITTPTMWTKLKLPVPQWLTFTNSHASMSQQTLLRSQWGQESLKCFGQQGHFRLNTPGFWICWTSIFRMFLFFKTFEEKKYEAQNIKQKYKESNFIGNEAWYFESIALRSKIRRVFSKFKIITFNLEWKANPEDEGEKIMERTRRRMSVTAVINAALHQARLWTPSFNVHYTLRWVLLFPLFSDEEIRTQRG